MADADTVLLEMVKGLRHDVATIRDNHLAHIAEDIDTIKAEQAMARRDIDELMEFKTEIRDCIKSGINRLIVAVSAVVTAALGLPMAL